MKNFKFEKHVSIVGKLVIKNIEPISTTFAELSPEKGMRFTFERKNELNNALQLGQTHMMHEGQEKATCFITGGSLKARIRHACADLIIQTRASQGKPVSLKDIYALKVGQIADQKGNKELSEETGGEVKNDAFADRAFREANPLLSHFGLFHLASSIAVGHGLPKAPIQPSVLGGVRFDINPQYILDHTSKEDQEVFLARKNRNATKSILEGEIKDLEKQLKAELKKCPKGEDKKPIPSETALKLQADIETKKASFEEFKAAQGDQTISTQMPLSRHVVPVGNEFFSTIVLTDNANSNASSMLIHGLQSLSMYPKIGGYKSNGGQVEMTIEFKSVNADGSNESLGSIAVGGYQAVDTSGLTELGQSWWKQAVADDSWKDKIAL